MNADIKGCRLDRALHEPPTAAGSEAATRTPPHNGKGSSSCASQLFCVQFNRIRSGIPVPAFVSSLRRSVSVLLAELMLLTAAGTALSCTVGQLPPTGYVALNDGSKDRNDCRVRLERFIVELDELLEARPSSLEPLLSLLKEHFPLKSCDIEDAIRISKSSKYFASVYEQPTLYVIAFTSATGSSRPFSAFDISFGLLKQSGDSELPFARVHK